MKKATFLLFISLCLFISFLFGQGLDNGLACVGDNDTTFQATGGLQTFTVPDGVTELDITAIGAGGGVSNVTSSSTTQGGKGAVINGSFSVTPGQTLTILVGAKGEDSDFRMGGGGGGTFVFGGTVSLVNLLIAAGGGGSGAFGSNVRDASTTTDARAGGTGNTPPGAAGVGTGGGGGSGSIFGGAGGAGITGDGGDGLCGANSGGDAIISGGAGGAGACSGGNGGYGGGGEGGNNGGAGGGGYAGGGAGGHVGSGGGGSSFVAGSVIAGSSGLALVPADGLVKICYSISTTPPIPTMSEWGIFLFGLIVFTIAVVGIFNLKGRRFPNFKE